MQFLSGDLLRIGTDFPRGILDDLAHPVLVVEDAHVNLHEVYEFFDPHLAPGDYLVVEDSAEKAEILGAWLAGKGDRYLVDTRYVDFFGQNATQAGDSILACRGESSR